MSESAQTARPPLTRETVIGRCPACGKETTLGNAALDLSVVDDRAWHQACWEESCRYMAGYVPVLMATNGRVAS